MAFNKDEQGIQRDANDNVTAVKLDKHVLDPNSPDAVQIPEDTIPGNAAYPAPNRPDIGGSYDDVENADF